MKDTLRVTTALLFFALGALAVPAAAADEPQATFGERVDVRVVNVEAVVTGPDGMRVLGLTPEDFRLRVDGQEVPVEFFTEFRGGQALRDVGASPWDVAPISSRQAEGTSYLVFVDDFFSVGIDRDRVLRSLADDLSHLRAEDRMAIVAWDGLRTRMLTSWTSSHRELEEALRIAADRPAGGLERLMERQSILSGRYLTAGSYQAVGRRLDITERVYANILVDQVENAVEAASSALRGFAGPPGRKVMLLVSGGWPFAPADFVTGDPFSAELDGAFDRDREIFGPLVETANLLGYTLYPVDGPGLQASAGVDATNRPSGSLAGLRSLDAFQERELHDSLRYLARETGGRALLNGQRVEALPRVASDTSSFYWMGFSPVRTGDGETRSIELEVLRPGFKVHTRSGYRDLSIEDEVTMQVESALLFGDPAHSNELALEIGEGEAAKRRQMVVPIIVRMPVSAVALLPSNGDSLAADLEVRIAAIDERGDRSGVTVLPWRVTREAAPAAGDSLEFATALRLRNRPQEVVVAVYDTRSGALFSTSAEVDRLALR